MSLVVIFTFITFGRGAGHRGGWGGGANTECREGPGSICGEGGQPLRVGRVQVHKHMACYIKIKSFPFSLISLDLILSHVHTSKGYWSEYKLVNPLRPVPSGFFGRHLIILVGLPSPNLDLPATV